MSMRRPRVEERARWTPEMRIEGAENDLDAHERQMAQLSQDLGGKIDRLQWTLVGFTLTLAATASAILLSGVLA